MFSLREALGWLSAATLIGDGDTRIQRVCTDSRAVRPGDLFVAVRGERFDANAFASRARAAGAKAVVVERRVEGLAPPCLIVPDGRRALGELAAGWRARFALPVIAVTGSNGKTTVKEMISAILAESVGQAHRLATRGNLNNDVGLPLTVFELNAAHRLAVLELGMNRRGEIAWLAGIARPTVSVVTNAQREHQEFMATVEATAYENGASIRALPDDGVAVFPGDDLYTPIWSTLAGARRTLSFGLTPACKVRADPDARPELFTMRIGEDAIDVRLAIGGAHNVRNALAAAACCAAVGIDARTIAAGLARFRPVTGRLVRHELPSGATLIDDSYNANPDSVRAAIDVLAQARAPRVLVLGDMGEVGDQGPRFHREVGDYARQRGLEHLLALGEATRETVSACGVGAEHFESIEPLLERARALAAGGSTLLVKGSRFMRMERAVAALTGAAVAQAH